MNILMRYYYVFKIKKQQFIIILLICFPPKTEKLIQG